MRVSFMQYMTLFDKDYLRRSPTTGVITQRDLPFLRKGFQHNVEKIQEYYLSRNFFVKNTNIISRLVELFPVQLQYNDIEYLDTMVNRLTYLAKHFRFTSDLEKGIVHAPYFFGNFGEEVIISNFDYFDLKEAKMNWERTNSIEVMRHPRNDDRLLLPLGNVDGNRGGLSVISINIPKLAFQYREFEKLQYRRMQETGTAATKNQYVTKYVLPSMMNDVTDHTLLNKLMDRWYGVEPTEPKYKHRFPLLQPTTQVDRYLDDTLEVISTKNIDFVGILRNIKLIFKEDASELLALGSIGNTRQSKWAALVARIDYMIFLLDVSKDLSRSRHHINDWKRLAERFKNDNFLKDAFSASTNYELDEKLYRLRNL